MSKIFGLKLLNGTAQAMAIDGIVLAEAIALYVGYGSLTQIVGPTIRESLGGE